jgi:hypothetical protein
MDVIASLILLRVSVHFIPNDLLTSVLIGVEGGGELAVLWVNLKNLLWGSVSLGQFT